MKKPIKSSQLLKDVSEELVVKYLRQHPDFFGHQQELLASMEITNFNDALVALAEQKVKKSQKDNQNLQDKMDELIVIAQGNDRLNQRIRHLVATLVEVEGLDEFCKALYDSLCNDFNTDVVIMRWFGASNAVLKQAEFVEYDAEVFHLFEELLETNEPICGELSAEQVTYLFPQHEVVSAVLIPLGNLQHQGILAMGSNEAERFQADMNTDFLKFLGELVSHLLRMWMRPSFIG